MLESPEGERKLEANAGWTQPSGTPGEGCLYQEAICRAEAGAPRVVEVVIPVTHPTLSPLPQSTFIDQEYKSGFYDEKFHRCYMPSSLPCGWLPGIQMIIWLSMWGVHGQMTAREQVWTLVFLFFHNFGYCESIPEN